MANWQLDAYRQAAGEASKRPGSAQRSNRGDARDGSPAGSSGGAGKGKPGEAAPAHFGPAVSGRSVVGSGESVNESGPSPGGGGRSVAEGSGESRAREKRRKVAVLLNAVGSEEAAAILRRLPTSQAEQIAHESLLMDPPDPSETQDVMREFGFLRETAKGPNPASGPKLGDSMNPASGNQRGNSPGSPSGKPAWMRAHEALTLAFGEEKADRILHKAVPEAGRMRFTFLSEFDVPQLKTLFCGENSFTVALVVSQSAPEVAARILRAVEPDMRKEVVTRVAHMRQLQPEIVQKVAESLKNRWREVGTERAPQGGGGISTLAGIIKHLDDGHLIETLAEEEPELASAVKEQIYSIEMVLKVPDRQLAGILTDFDDHAIAMLLKGKSEEIRAKIMNNVSGRRATMVSEEYRDLGPQRREDVGKITHEFVVRLRNMAENGELLVSDPDDRYI